MIFGELRFLWWGGKTILEVTFSVILLFYNVYNVQKCLECQKLWRIVRITLVFAVDDCSEGIRILRVTNMHEFQLIFFNEILFLFVHFYKFFQFLSNVASICYLKLKGTSVCDVCLKLFYYSLQSRIIYFDYEFFFCWKLDAYIIQNEKRQKKSKPRTATNKKSIEQNGKKTIWRYPFSMTVLYNFQEIRRKFARPKCLVFNFDRWKRYRKFGNRPIKSIFVPSGSGVAAVTSVQEQYTVTNTFLFFKEIFVQGAFFRTKWIRRKVFNKQRF